MNIDSITFRAVGPTDAAFLAELYRTTRWEELAGTGWSESQKRTFLRQQFACQTADWDRRYPHARRQIILVDGVAAGRLIVDVRPADGARHITDISLLPEFRGQGVGSTVLRGVLAEAATGGQRVTIMVEPHNPARRLYLRLGFAPVQDHGSHLLLERPAERGVPTA